MNKILFFTFFIALSNSAIYGQGQADYYKAAANAYRNTANQTKCPVRKQWLMQQAGWNDCMVARLGGSKSLCSEVTTPMPPCDADNGGNTSSTGGTGSVNNSNSSSGASNLIESANAGLAFSSAYQSAISSGKKESGAMLNATLAATSQLSDPGAIKGVATMGGLLTLLNFLGEQKEEKLKRQKEAKEVALQLFSENNKVLVSWERADFSHKTGTIYLERNKKGYIKSIEFKEGFNKFYDYVAVENSADSVRLVMVEQYSMGNKQINYIDVIHEYRFSIRDIVACTFYEYREEFSSLSDETEISYINPINMKAVANIVAEGDIGTSSTSLPNGLYKLQLNLRAYEYRELESFPDQLKDSFLSFFDMPFNKNTGDHLDFHFGSESDGKNIYNILKVFTY